MRLSWWIVILAVAAGCSSETKVVVGSKDFIEQDILGELLAQELEAHGVPVERRFHLGGTLVSHRALVEGSIDLYVEYTGTALSAILEQPVIHDPDSVLASVRREYRDRWELEWAAPLGFENTFALVVRGVAADSFRLETIEDLARMAPWWTAGFGPEFMVRPDGYAGLQAHYGVEFGAVKQLDLGLMYRALVEGDIDVAVANSTDGQIVGLDLKVLEDNRHYFPPYQAAPIIRSETLDRFPVVREALDVLGNALTADDMRRLNYDVGVGGEHYASVVRDWRARRSADDTP